MNANEKIIALVKPEYLNKIPKIFRKHATENTFKLIVKEHPDLYKNIKCCKKAIFSIHAVDCFFCA